MPKTSVPAQGTLVCSTFLELAEPKTLGREALILPRAGTAKNTRERNSDYRVLQKLGIPFRQKR